MRQLRPHVQILMATHNAGPLLDTQLASLLSQSWTGWSLSANDDGSHDNTLDKLQRFAAQSPNHVSKISSRSYSGTGMRRAATNFFDLILESATQPDSYVALCDQDDHWHPGKLAAALAALSNHEGPAAYACALRPADKCLRATGPRRRFALPPSFENALAQNVMSGNTIVLNPSALHVLRRLIPQAKQAGVCAHDWWIYLVLTGIGARVCLDQRVWIDYVQHDKNLMRGRNVYTGALRKVSLVLGGTYAHWSRANFEALKRDASHLTNDARLALHKMTSARTLSPLARMSRLRDLPAHRQTRIGTAAHRTMFGLGLC